MRENLRTGVSIAACLLLCFGVQAMGQAGNGPVGGELGGQYGPASQGAGPGGSGPGGRVGFGNMGQPIQGIVTAVTSSTLTLNTDAGTVYTVTVGSDVRIVENRQAIQIGNIKVGDSVTAVGSVDATKQTVKAMMLSVIDAATVERAKENLGKTYITGKITAIDTDNLKLSILRSDTVSQTIEVDEGTSFQRGTRGVSADVVAAGGLPIGMGGMGGSRGMGGNRQGGQAGAQPSGPPPAESITLADIKVGDNMMATGALKGGIFTALKMGVSGPAPGMAARRRTADNPTGPPPDSPPSGLQPSGPQP